MQNALPHQAAVQSRARGWPSIEPCPSPHPCLSTTGTHHNCHTDLHLCSEHRAPASLPGNLNCLTPTGCAPLLPSSNPLQSLTCELAFGCDVTAAWRNEWEKTPKNPKTPTGSAPADDRSRAPTLPLRDPQNKKKTPELCVCILRSNVPRMAFRAEYRAVGNCAHPSATCVGCTTAVTDPTNETLGSLSAWQFSVQGNKEKKRSSKYPPFHQQDGDPVASPLRHNLHGRRTSAARVPPGEAAGSGNLTHGSLPEAGPARNLPHHRCVLFCGHVRAYQGPQERCTYRKTISKYRTVGGPAESGWCERAPLLLLPASPPLHTYTSLCVCVFLSLPKPCMALPV